MKWTLEDFKRTEHGLEDPEGLHYNNSEDAMMVGVLGFCGCGMPEATMVFIAEGLRLLHQRLNEPPTEYKEWDARVTSHFGSCGARYFFWFWCDKEGLTEHGGSVPGWLTGRGVTILAELDEIIASEDFDV